MNFTQYRSKQTISTASQCFPACCVCAALLLLLVAQCAIAQDAIAPAEESPDDDVALPTVKVTASALQTTTGMALSVQQTPQSVTVIPMDQLDEQGVTSMEDALKTTTGINVSRNGNQMRLESRGFSINQIEEDGVASTVSAGADGNPYRDAQSMSDLAIYEHIEVVRGATGLTQANSDPGGTINAVRKKPTTQFQAKAETSIDHRGGTRLMGDVSGTQHHGVRPVYPARQRDCTTRLGHKP